MLATKTDNEVQKNLDILLTLQEIDSDLSRLTKITVDLPSLLNKHLEAYKKEELVVNDLKQTIESNRKQCRDYERDAQSSNDSLKKHNGKLGVVKTNKEYAALLSEIEILKIKINKIEDEELILMDEIEKQKDELKEKELSLSNHKKELDKREIANKTEIGKVNITIEEKKKKRESIVPNLSENLYIEYTKTYKLRSEVAISILKKDLCCGCHQKVRPQLSIEINRFDAISKCPHCDRFLYPKE